MALPSQFTTMFIKQIKKRNGGTVMVFGWWDSIKQVELYTRGVDKNLFLVSGLMKLNQELKRNKMAISAFTDGHTAK